MNIIQKFNLNKTYKTCTQVMCYECMGADIKNASYEKGTQRLIKECNAYSCPLYSVRPHK
jgi:hypothetical protein